MVNCDPFPHHTRILLQAIRKLIVLVARYGRRWCVAQVEAYAVDTHSPFTHSLWTAGRLEWSEIFALSFHGGRFVV